MSDIELGDLFRDTDSRHPDRIIRVVHVGTEKVTVENVEHWNERLIGRHTRMSRHTLAKRFKKVSH